MCVGFVYTTPYRLYISTSNIHMFDVEMQRWHSTGQKSELSSSATVPIHPVFKTLGIGPMHGEFWDSPVGEERTGSSLRMGKTSFGNQNSECCRDFGWERASKS